VSGGPPPALLLLDAPAARYALNALAGAAERLAPEAMVGWARDPAELGRRCADLASRGRRVVAGWSFASAGLRAAAAGLASARAAGGSSALHVAGGAHATAAPERVLRAGFDLAAVGEGEVALARLLLRLAAGGEARGPGFAWLEDGRPTRGPMPPAADLDDLPPFPSSGARGGAIEITRGCVHACRFCQTSFAAGARLRHRSPEAVARWVELQARCGRPDVRFVSPSALAYGSDDGAPRLDRVEALLVAARAAAGPEGRLFLGTFPSEVRPEHVTPEALRLLRRLADNRTLLVGAQSGSERVLARAHRGHGVGEVERAVALALEAGFEPQVDFIAGLPGEEEEDRRATRALMAALTERGAKVHLHAFLPLPGTPWAGEAPGRPDAASERLMEALASRGRAFGQWRRQVEAGRELVRLRGAAAK